MSRASCWREIGALTVATSVGALWDEHLTAGLTSFVSMCRTADPDLVRLLTSFIVLLPVATLATLAVSASLLLAGTRMNTGGRHRMLIAHLGCLVAMPAGLWLCSRASNVIDTAPKALAVMLLVDTALMFAAVYVLGGVRRSAWLEERAPGRS
jgi:hypothetical protein